MPKGKAIKSAKQFRFMHAAKAGNVPGLSPSVAGKLLNETSESRKKKFAKAFRRHK